MKTFVIEREKQANLRIEAMTFDVKEGFFVLYDDDVQKVAAIPREAAIACYAEDAEAEDAEEDS